MSSAMQLSYGLPLRSSTSAPRLLPNAALSTAPRKHPISLPTRNSRATSTRLFSSSSKSDNQTALIVPPDGTHKSTESTAAEVVRSFYDGINRRHLSSVEDLIALNCVYEDLIFPRPFVGREAILEFFKKFTDSISADLQFVIDDISSEDSAAVGVSWHLDWKGKPFPFSKGCSFYRLQVIDGKTQIIYGRDSVEPAFKPGEAALAGIRGLTWLLDQFPQLGDRF